MTDYKVRVKDSSGTLKAEFSSFIDLAYKNVDIGILELNLRSDHDAVQYFTDKAIVEVWRRNSEFNVDWYRDFVTFFRDENRSNLNQKKRFNAVCLGVKEMLNWRVVNYPSRTTNQSTFVNKKAEYIMKRLAEFNCGVFATTGFGRKRTGTISNFVVEANGDNGNRLDWNCHGKNVLGELQKIALSGGGDFDVILTGTNSWEFKYFDGQLGTDRSSTVIFSLARGNMANPVYERIRSSEKTIACVWGRGESTNRDYLTVTGSNYSASNDIEIYVDARQTQEGGVDYYKSKGDTVLQENKSTDDFSFDVLQTPASMYGKHYFLGDIVTAEYDDITATPKIISIQISFDGQREKIDVGLDTSYA
jgi:hypothetical protein